MNGKMIVAADLPLRRHVERAVRPVRASERRRMAMREELLAHLLGILSEELARHGDEQAATAAALSRFGPPSDVTRELNRSLPASERLLWAAEWWERRLDAFWSIGRGQSIWAYSLRIIPVISALTLALVTGVVGGAWLLSGLAEPGTTFFLLSRLVPLMIVGESAAAIATACVDRLVRRTAGPRRWLGLLVQSIAWSGFLTVSTLVFWRSISNQPIDAAFAVRLAGQILAVAGGLLCLVAITAAAAHRRHDTYDLWLSLNLDE